jgi:hypothetical protein
MAGYPLANPLDRHRKRTLLTFGGCVLAFFTSIDLVIVLWPNVGEFYLRNAAALLVLGAAATLAVVGIAISTWVRSGRKASQDAFESVLDELPGCDAVHALKTRRGRIDHVVVGACGVYVLARNDQRGRVNVDHRGVRVGGRLLPASQLHRLAAQARYLQSRIEVVVGRRLPVQPLYVFTRAALPSPVPSGGVMLSCLSTLPSLLTRSQVLIDPQAVAVVRSLLAGEVPGVPEATRAVWDSFTDRGLFDREGSHRC